MYAGQCGEMLARHGCAGSVAVRRQNHMAGEARYMTEKARFVITRGSLAPLQSTGYATPGLSRARGNNRAVANWLQLE